MTHEEQLQRFDALLHHPIQLIAEDGQPFEVPVQGTLGLLALGHLGLIAWRRKRRNVFSIQYPAISDQYSD